MKAWTDGTWVYTVGSLGANCWRQIWFYHLSDLGKATRFWMLTSQHPLYKILNNTEWISDEAAENALAECASACGWKEI